MSSADPDRDLDDEAIWYRIDLDEVAALVDDYTRRLWKDHPWYHRVDWQRVSSAVDDVLQHVCRDGLVVGDDLEQQLGPVERTLGRSDAEGLASLVMFPVQISRYQVHDGGHRSAAMRAQGVRFVPGWCVRGDIGSGVAAGQVYPVQEASLGGLSRSEKAE